MDSDLTFLQYIKNTHLIYIFGILSMKYKI
ncbi:DUF3944 domain-containing protein [Winogradskyella flava]|uniref:DUF3944 domain-containing protein n=1 Tax=Winogradskyella flava TaxID=1884876 RepID=A0A842IPW7_9FLAO|nr:DUF3944 domain-containing protein [Winogradskyella flava]